MFSPAPVHAEPIHDHADLIGVVRCHAEERPDRAAFAFLLENGAERVLTYAQLDRSARAVGAMLQDLGLEGARVVLAYPQGLDFIIGFFGCLYAGCVAVPTSLPTRRTVDRFLGIASDAQARCVLSTAAVAAHCQCVIAAGSPSTEGAAPIPWMATDGISGDSAERWSATEIDPDALAMLQYTSGSTCDPKGVMLTHGNLIHNTRAIHRAFGMGRDTAVFWLPTFHDMGLVGGILEPVLGGVTSVLMSPSTFLQEPVAWLAAITRYRATISGGPNFAYDLCVRRITDAQRATLDLSCWALAFVGAEPTDPGTLERFAAAFAPCGFKPTAFYPCYGLAEATLMVTGPARGDGPTVRAFNGTALAKNRIACVTSHGSKARRLASCGKPIGDTRIVIVDPDTCTTVAPDRVGEIWVAGGSVGRGYWRKPEHTRRAFNAEIRDTGEGGFLRTGDLGFVLEGEIYITGRRDDMLIVRGMNHHPQDVESTARQSHRSVESGAGAAFSVDDHSGSRLVLVQEVARNGQTDCVPVLDAVQGAVLEAHGLMIHSIVLVRSGTIPKTSSGKVQRRACRAAFLSGEIKAVAERHRVGAPGTDAIDAPHPRNLAARVEQAIAFPQAQSRQSCVLGTVCQHAIALGGAALSDVTPDTPLTALGLDSLQRVELAAMLEKTFGCRLPDTGFHPAQTLGELARAVEQHIKAGSKSDGPATLIPREHHEFGHFPEYAELKRYERVLRAVAGENPYFRVDCGRSPSPAAARGAAIEAVNFCVYDYIGLAHDATVAAAAKAAIDRYGTSAGASRLVFGEKQVHRDLERALASFLGTASALVFVSGHATNVTTIGHLLGPEDLIVYDALAHNSIIQGAQLSGATRRAFAHNDWKAMDALLSEVRHRYRRVLIAVEGVYSMDGDYPDLPRFVELKKKHKALMLVDEAHSLGTMGPTGRGIGEHWGVARDDVDMWMGTLSKSLASCGGYIAGSAEIVEYLAYTAPGFVYSVGVSPPNAGAALAALRVLEAQPQRVSRLRELSELFLSLAKARGLETGRAAGTPVVPVIIGNPVTTLRLSRALLERGINVQPILPPAVPERSARLRFFITTSHTEAQIRDTVAIIADELAKL